MCPLGHKHDASGVLLTRSARARASNTPYPQQISAPLVTLNDIGGFETDGPALRSIGDMGISDGPMVGAFTLRRRINDGGYCKHADLSTD